MPILLAATGDRILRVAPERPGATPGRGLEGRYPTCLASDRAGSGRAWCGTTDDGVWRTEDAGASWGPSGLPGTHVTALAVDLAEEGVVYAGAEPSEVHVSRDGGRTWTATADLLELPSSGEWSFPPKPHTHHVRWIAVHPLRPGRLWVAIEAGALVRTADGGRSWTDRVAGGPFDTHEVAIHPEVPDRLRVAAGDGYFESPDDGESWSTPREGLDVGYFRSVAVDPHDPEVTLVSGASRPRSTYVAGRSDGRVYRREGEAPWEPVTRGWPDPPQTIAPLLRSGSGRLWAADERGVHASADGGRGWEAVVRFDPVPANLRGFVVL